MLNVPTEGVRVKVITDNKSASVYEINHYLSLQPVGTTLVDIKHNVTTLRNKSTGKEYHNEYTTMIITRYVEPVTVDSQ